jgi:hypothetical protein
MLRQQVLGLASVLLAGWGAFLVYDVVKLKETPEFQQKVRAAEGQKSKLQETGKQ